MEIIPVEIYSQLEDIYHMDIYTVWTYIQCEQISSVEIDSVNISSVKVHPVWIYVNSGGISAVEIYFMGIYLMCKDIVDAKTTAIFNFLSSNFIKYITILQPQWPGTGTNTM